MSAKLWCVARCVGVRDPEHDGCLVTSWGAYGAANAERAARDRGWVIRHGGWLCPVCARRRRVEERIGYFGDDDLR